MKCGQKTKGIISDLLSVKSSENIMALHDAASRQCLSGLPLRFELINAVITPIFASPSQIQMNSGRLVMNKAITSPFWNPASLNILPILLL